MKSGITGLNQTKDDIAFVTEFQCFLGHPVVNKQEMSQSLKVVPVMTHKYNFLKRVLIGVICLERCKNEFFLYTKPSTFSLGYVHGGDFVLWSCLCKHWFLSLLPVISFISRPLCPTVIQRLQGLMQKSIKILFITS